MRTYELLFIVDNDLTDEQKDATVEKVKGLIEKESGVVTTVDKWGTRKLAYPINFKSEGFYCLMVFESGVAAPAALDAVLNITDGVVRHMIVQK